MRKGKRFLEKENMFIQNTEVKTHAEIDENNEATINAETEFADFNTILSFCKSRCVSASSAKLLRCHAAPESLGHISRAVRCEDIVYILVEDVAEIYDTVTVETARNDSAVN